MPLGQSEFSSGRDNEAASWISQTKADNDFTHRCMSATQIEYFPRKPLRNRKKIY
jgi:hypothetical protein